MPLPPVNHSLGTPFIELQSIDSTNNYALDQIHANLAKEGACYFAHEQWAGRGQRGKTWESEQSANLALTIVVKPFFLKPALQFPLSACVAVAIHETMKEFIPEDLKIKWPNDLYWKDRKLGGILIENIIGRNGEDLSNQQPPASPLLKTAGSFAEWKWSAIGIGINVNQSNFQTMDRKPVSLKQITGKTFEPVKLAKNICAQLDRYYNQLQSEGSKLILENYNARLYKRNEIVRLKKDNRIFEAEIRSVDESGRIVIFHSLEEKIDHGEIDWITNNSDS